MDVDELIVSLQKYLPSILCAHKAGNGAWMRCLGWQPEFLVIPSEPALHDLVNLT